MGTFSVHPRSAWRKIEEYRIDVECECGYFATAFHAPATRRTDAHAVCTKCGRFGDVALTDLPALPAPTHRDSEGREG